jgi:hypothetical protein
MDRETPPPSRMPWVNLSARRNGVMGDVLIDKQYEKKERRRIERWQSERVRERGDRRERRGR